MWGLQVCRYLYHTDPWSSCSCHILDLDTSCWSYDGIYGANSHLFTPKHVPGQAPDWHFKRAHINQLLIKVCYVTQCMELWIDAGPFYVHSLHSKDDVFQFLDEINTQIFSPFTPKKFFTVSKPAIKFAKNGPWNHEFSSLWELQMCFSGL